EADTLISELYAITLVTDTVAGEHWIVPGTLVSNNFNISYGLGKLYILPEENTNARIASNAQEIQPEEEHIGLKVYPNPVKDKLVIELDNAATSEIKLFDSQGKSCKAQSVVNSSSSTVEI